MGPTTARGVVSAEAVRDALDLLTEIAAPLRVRLELKPEGFSLTTHGDEPWWATVDVPVIGQVTDDASASVARLEFRQAVDAEAILVPAATCSVTIVADEVVRYGGFAFPAVSPPEPAPPAIDGPTTSIGAWEVAGGRYELADGRVFELPRPSLDRFTAREIESVALVEDPSGPYLVGRARGRGIAELVLVAAGRWAVASAAE